MTINFLASATITQGAGAVPAIQSDKFGLQQINRVGFAAHTANAATSGAIPTWTGVEFDLKNNFNAGTGKFTASIAGTYFFKYYQLVNHATAGEYRANLLLNGNGITGRSIFYKINSNVHTTIQVEARVNLNVGDWVSAYIEVAPAAMAADAGWSFFQGYRI